MRIVLRHDVMREYVINVLGHLFIFFILYNLNMSYICILLLLLLLVIKSLIYLYTVGRTYEM